MSAAQWAVFKSVQFIDCIDSIRFVIFSEREMERCMAPDLIERTWLCPPLLVMNRFPPNMNSPNNRCSYVLLLTQWLVCVELSFSLESHSPPLLPLVVVGWFNWNALEWRRARPPARRDPLRRCYFLAVSYMWVLMLLTWWRPVLHTYTNTLAPSWCVVRAVVNSFNRLIDGKWFVVVCGLSLLQSYWSDFAGAMCYTTWKLNPPGPVQLERKFVYWTHDYAAQPAQCIILFLFWF